MSDAGLDRVTKSLDRIAIVLAALYANGLKNTDPQQKVEKLCSLGFSNVQVAAALGMTANAVNVARHRVRKKGKDRKKPTSAPKSR